VTQSWKLEDLATHAGVSARTVRYYVQRGLLPAPAFKGRDTVYTDDHLLRLRAIRKLQDKFLPLDAIQVELARLTPAELQELVDGTTYKMTSYPPLVLGESPAKYDTGMPVPRVDWPSRATRTTETWTRIALAPGLELHLADTASAATRELAEQLRQSAVMKGNRE
jgi:DNA-binding transcriptional MerR regulator